MCWRAALLAAAAALSGCYRGIPMTPPPVYMEWWQQTKDCVGNLDADFGRIRWFVRRERYFECGGEMAWACWYRPHNIAIAEHRVAARSTVKHEMLHDLFRGGDHEDEAFTRCTR